MKLVHFALVLLFHSPSSAQDCTVGGLCDKHERCAAWKEEGECFKNKEYMLEECAASCSDEDNQTEDDDVCKDHHARCSVWADLGECTENPTNMNRFCAKACGLCSGDDEFDDDCQDQETRCKFWASSGECSANPVYMHVNCAKSCGTCEIIKRKSDKVNDLKAGVEKLSEEDLKVVAETVNFGDTQKAEGKDKYAIVDVIRKSIEYMKTDAVHLPEKIREKCLNRNDLCSFWASIGECDKNKAFMLTNCAPACRTCHLIDFDARCPPLTDPVPALEPGQLNKMFENIVKDAPGNRTLSDEERRDLQEKLIPEYTVNVISRPSSSSSIEISSVLDMSLPPWIISFDGFLTAEECQTLIDLGHQAGYERSRDVGPQKFDGSFEGAESSGRTSENAWCSTSKNCRQNEVVQRVMNRMSSVLGIPADNSEDLQILKYEKTQFYNSHHDYIPHQKDRQCGPRILTFFLYLSDVEAGGGTNFNKLDLTVMPKMGSAVLWPSIYDSDPLKDDPRTYHEALPVEAGTKFAANAWIHMYDYITPQNGGCT